MRHSCGAEQWTAALRSWVGESPDPFKTKLIVATGASFSRARHSRATFSNDRPGVSRHNHGSGFRAPTAGFESFVNYGRVKLLIVSGLAARTDG